MAGLSDYEGGYSEFIMVPTYRFLIKVEKQLATTTTNNSYNIRPEELAPLTDAGLTPYRAIKKVRHLLGPGKSIAIIGIGGLFICYTICKDSRAVIYCDCTGS